MLSVSKNFINQLRAALLVRSVKVCTYSAFFRTRQCPGRKNLPGIRKGTPLRSLSSVHFFDEYQRSEYHQRYSIKIII